MSARAWRWWAALGGGLALVAFFTFPLLGSLTGLRVAGRIGVLWLVPVAAVVLVLLGVWRGPVSVKRRAWIVGVAGVAAFGHVVALMVLRHPVGASGVHAEGIDPVSAVGPAYWISVAGFAAAVAAGVPGLLTVRSRPVLAGAIAGMMLGTVAGSAVLDVRQDRSRRTVVLLAADGLGEAAFGQDLVTEPAAARTSAGDIGDTVTGDHEDLFGGTWQKPSCERDRIAALVAGASSVRSGSWLAATRDSSESTSNDARRYVEGLTPVRLRADVLVTAHGFAGDRAYPYQSVLQAGTAVLVDQRGVPRARCAGAIPLAPPRDPVPAPDYRGTRWEGFDPAALVTVTPASRNVRQFGMTGDSRTFRRPVGTDGGRDVDLVPAQAVVDGTYVLTGKQATCNLRNCTESAEIGISFTVSGCPDRCVVSSSNWADTPTMVESAGTWTASGKPSSGFECADKPVTTTFSVSLRAKTGKLIAGLWAAEQVEGVYGKHSSGASCNDGHLTWAVTGTRK